MSETLAPPNVSAASVITLEPPKPVTRVEPQKADEMVTLSVADKADLNERVQTFVEAVATLGVHSEEFKAQVNAVHAMGSREIREAAGMSNRMLDRPTKVLNDGVIGEGTTVGNALVDLRHTIDDLDPSKQGNLFTPKKLFGFIPYGNRLRGYFSKYQSSQTHINRIIEALYRSQDELKRDNAAIEQEKVRLWETMQHLKKYAYVGKEIDRVLSAKIAQIEVTDAEKARVVKEELLFYTRQKITDLLTQEAVSIQGYLALDMIRKNNLELIKGVDRATTTTVLALRTAVMVASALGTQKLVLDQITALNKTTSDLILGTSSMLKQQSTKIQEGAASSTVEMGKLKAAFRNIYDTMDMMSDFKVKALDSMQQTINTLTTEIDNAQGYVDRVRNEDLKTLDDQPSALAF
jgi:uncharacterized protein YaaN involved in tellurite resistance